MKNTCSVDEFLAPDVTSTDYQDIEATKPCNSEQCCAQSILTLNRVDSSETIAKSGYTWESSSKEFG
jgi:hypothetical protein